MKRAWDEVPAAVLLWLVAAAVAGVFFWLLADIVVHGLPRLSWEFLLEAPRDAGRKGGIGPILVSTVLILAVCLAVALPVGLGTAVMLSEFTRADSRFGPAVRGSLDVLAGVPSIVFGLFGNAFFSIYLGLGFSILSGGLTLACMVLPLLIRTCEEGLRAVPDTYRAAAAALGLSPRATLRWILLPAAIPSIVAGLILGFGRAVAETAALLFTSGYVDRFPGSLLDSGRALSIHIFDLSMNVPGGNASAYASALVLILLFLAANLLTHWVGARWFQQRILPF